jgi:hypothetical protein
MEIVESLCQAALFQPGQKVKTFRGSMAGVIVRLLPDGRVVWRPEASGAELIASPESLVRAE